MSRSALVTGGESGIGFATANGPLASADHVALTSRTSPPLTEPLTNQRDPEQVEQARQRSETERGHVAPAVAFLAHDVASHSTGAVGPVDGGAGLGH